MDKNDMLQISIEDVKLAYKKFKSYVYYDNYSMILRQKLSEFETSNSFNDELLLLEKFLKNPDSESEYFQNLLSQINYIIVPKHYKKDELDDDFILTNSFTQDHYTVDKVNYLIDAPIPIHIISVLWILKEGYVLAKDYKKNNYAYALETESSTNHVVDGLRLFKPYFEQYQKWRDNSIETALDFINKDVDVVIVGLDIKKYYYNIDFSKKKSSLKDSMIYALGLDIETKPELKFTDLLFKIHGAYIAKLDKDNHKHESKEFIPIGLLSSGILANWYLKDFDYKILENLSPAFYGRYVDDILIVLSNTKPPEYKKEEQEKFNSGLELFFDKFFVKRNILKIDYPENKIDRIRENFREIKSLNDLDEIRRELDSFSYTWTEDDKIQIQKNKISVYSFNSKESKAVLEKFKQNIKKNSSAFWFLPDDQDVSNSFDESVYELTYNDTVNKLRSVSEIKQNKYGASVFLAKKIKLSLLSNQKYDDKTKEQILTFFKGRMNLEFNSVWEKVLTYFVVNNDRDSFWQFFNESYTSIDKIKVEENKNFPDSITKRLRDDMKEFLFNCCAMAVSLNSDFFNDALEKKFNNLEV